MTCLQTSDPEIMAIGEVAWHRGMIYGLVAPGYEMADVVAANLTGSQRVFTGFDMSTKLKLMGVEVASFGDILAERVSARALTYEDPFGGVYKKLVFNAAGTHLIGGVLVGDASEYGALVGHFKSGEPLAGSPRRAVDRPRRAVGPAVPAAAAAPMLRSARATASSESQIRDAVRSKGLTTVAQVKTCTKAGTGCGGCLPQVADLVKAELKAIGKNGRQPPLRALPP